MIFRPKLVSLLALLSVFMVANVVSAQGPLGNAFTYQGRLTDGGAAPTGAYDLEFRLFDDPAAGGQVGGTLVKDNVPVTNGLFSVQLDFGAGAYGGNKRYLQMGVRPGASIGAFTPLTPRQEVTPSPYALYATGNWALTGNAGTNPATSFLGTTDNVTLTLRVNNVAGWRLVPNGANTPNVIGGYGGNYAGAGVFGATIGGGGTSGDLNLVTDNYGTVGGGGQNQAGGNDLIVTNDTYATVGGGNNNVAGNFSSTVAGGNGNHANGDYSSVGGGSGNNATDNYSTVSGGSSNTAGAGAASVGGGSGNAASGGYSTISGGADGIASGTNTTIGGGMDNTASGDFATVAGGESNNATGQNAAVGGGEYNDASAPYATIPGGYQALAYHYGEMAYSSGMFANFGDAQTSMYFLRGLSTSAATSELFLNGSSQRITVTLNSVWTFDILVAGRNNTTNSGAGYRITGVIENAAGTVAFIGTPTVTVLGEDVAAWTATVEADNTNDALVVNVSGTVATTIRWVAVVRTVQVKF